MDEFTALFSRKDMTFEEAVAYFKERVPVTASRFYQIAAEYRALAFTVSGYTKAQVLKKFYDELLAALEEGNSLAEFRENMNDFLEAEGYSIRLDGDTRAMLRRIRNFSEIDKQGINAALAEGVRESTLERFKQSKGPDGRRWKTSIRAAQEGGKTLIQSAQLRNSIHAKSDTSGFALGTNVKYAATHQFGEPGRTIRARKKKALRFQVGGKWVTKKQVRITIPARPFLGLSEDDMQEMKATVEEFIQKED